MDSFYRSIRYSRAPQHEIVKQPATCLFEKFPIGTPRKTKKKFIMNESNYETARNLLDTKTIA